MTWVKVCGLSRRTDVETAVEAEADAVGFVLARGSPRAVTVPEARALGEHVPALRTLVTVDLEAHDLLRAADGADADAVQPHGRHAEEAAAAAAAQGYLVLRPVAVGEVAIDLSRVPEDQIPLLDAAHPERHGGTGRRFDWDLIATDRRYVLAGGLDPESVTEAVARLEPWGVDASSGLESAPGAKDPGLIRAFVEAAKAAGAAGGSESGGERRPPPGLGPLGHPAPEGEGNGR